MDTYIMREVYGDQRYRIC